MSLQARTTFHDHPFNHKHLESHHLFHKFGFVQPKHTHNGDPLVPGNIDRLAPGGPDPNHNHALPPSKTNDSSQA
ncbi:hypothetical protein Lal_00045725 [Lupinus albus]|nr:hypothetical protein Lal_00045725 [Lupinus albus]